MWEDRRDRIDHDGPATLWAQVAADVEADIAAGDLTGGSRLPTELELAEIYGVARGTVRRAVADLADRGVIVVVHGRGTFVATGEQRT
ncbi:GntR family transcriptional regulator, phosphonate transport system regulatory protein [Saccharopolyspora shandongensis]|uniref:GntR family transcriptional regulator, phosphonate transport system regulatory protein n=1 Tax=Saccharopolyspora shandongensis TaxID=418495 RepID=A0A1H3M765_9PSEU|nr:GntR family transcriptional regulator [Saccharopolyspora shandongensis]SDY72098.1 GntR family transcriptional regulator, phosphonate transport system regulatory protein [Saccharopolyspora shandongensis]